MKKRNLFFLGVILVCLVGIGLVISPSSPVVEVNGHSADDVLITIKGHKMTLQHAITKGFLVYGASISPQSDAPTLYQYNTADEILVTFVNGHKKTLQEAIDNIDNGGLCSSSASGTTSIAVGHTADEIILDDDRTLQETIDLGYFCCVPDCTCAANTYVGSTCDDTCGRTCDGTKCKPNCAGDCGSDGCGGSCGNCDHSICSNCINGNCETDWVCALTLAGATVICTELYNKGLMDEATYKLEGEYAPQHFSPEVIRGYQVWAIPVVHSMRKNPEVTEKFILPLVNSFMEEIAYRLGKRETGNEAGALYLDRGVPLCERLGVLINEPNWRSLFDEGWLEDEIDPIYIKIFKIGIGNSLFSVGNIIGDFLEEENKYDELVKNYFTEEKIEEMFSFYDALEKEEKSEIELAQDFIDHLEESVEEIESMIASLEN